VTGFAVLDFETTGLLATRNDRVVEIAIVRLSADLAYRDEFRTLINPDRDLGPITIHGIRSRDVLNAPRFHEIAGDILDLLEGHVIVAHNATFDLAFLRAEFKRVGLELPEIPCICTMRLARTAGPSWIPTNLEGCCAAIGIEYADAHHALADARATAELFRRLASGGKSAECVGLKHEGPGWNIDGRGLERTGRAWHREQAIQEASEPCPHLSRLVYRVAGTIRLTDGQTGIGEYLDALQRVLEDRVITGEEAEILFEVAALWGLRPEGLVEAHRLYLRQLAIAALADGVVSDAEFGDLRAVNQMFGLGEDFLRETLEAAATSDRTSSHERESLRGRSVCFTGECTCTYKGEYLTRDDVHQIAANAGLSVKSSVTKKLDLLVVSDPHSQSGKAKKARDYGIRILHEPVFWQLLGVNVD
jgi:DNA polymerase-3 subunit epsilon